MIDPEVHVDLEDVVDGFVSLKRQARNLLPVWRELAPIMTRDQRANFSRREGPDGKWPPPSKRTEQRALGIAKRRAKKRGKKAPKRASRKQLGKLRTAFVVEMNRLFLRQRSKVPWSSIHQEGGVAAHGARIPKRTFHWASNEFLGLVVDRVAKHLKRRWKLKLGLAIILVIAWSVFISRVVFKPTFEIAARLWVVDMLA